MPVEGPRGLSLRPPPCGASAATGWKPQEEHAGRGGGVILYYTKYAISYYDMLYSTLLYYTIL